MAKAHEIAWYFETLEPGDVFEPNGQVMITVKSVDARRDRVTFRETRFNEDYEPESIRVLTWPRDDFAETYAGAAYTSAEEMRIMTAEIAAEFA